MKLKELFNSISRAIDDGFGASGYFPCGDLSIIPDDIIEYKELYRHLRSGIYFTSGAIGTLFTAGGLYFTNKYRKRR
jgi:hypothetical protein